LKKTFRLIKTNSSTTLDMVQEGGKRSQMVNRAKGKASKFLGDFKVQDMERISLGAIALVNQIHLWDLVVAWIKTRLRSRILVAPALRNIRFVGFRVSSRGKVERSCSISEAESWAAVDLLQRSTKL
jgi:hypothetical protein